MSPLFLLLTALSAPGLAFTLEEARDAAVEQSLSVERARATVAAAEADALMALAGGLPAITAFGSASTGAGLTAFGFPRPAQNQGALGARGSAVLLSPSLWAGAAAARRSVEGQEAMLQWAMVEARRQVTVTYTAALGAQARAEAWRRSAQDAQAAADATASLVNAGLRPASELTRLRAELASAEAEALAAEGDAIALCAALQGLMRAEITGQCSLSPTSLGDPEAADGDAHPAIVAARSALAAAEAQRTGATLGLGPTVTANGSVARFQVTGVEPGVGWSAGVEATQPLFVGGQGVAERRGAQAAADAANVELAQAEQDLEVARASALARYRAAAASAEARRVALDAAGDAFADVDARYEAGLVSLTDWLDARRARDAAAVSLALAEAALGAALAEREATTGVY